MNPELEKEVRSEYSDLLVKSGFPISKNELEMLEVNDLGLGDIRKEGFAFIDILRTNRLRITILMLLPNQSLPQHVHPPYEEEIGKEETIRVIFGQTKVYSAKDNQEHDPILIPTGKEKYYTARHETKLEQGQQFTVTPNTNHWFQGGNEGAVNICFQNRVDETRNIFFDPKSEGCLIMPEDE